MSEPRNTVPASACKLTGGETSFGEASGAKTPIRMLARSPQPIEHWWWGRVVHDMNGMKLHKKVLPVDYEHCEPIGYLNSFDATEKGLFVEGELVETDAPGDRVRQLLQLSRGGVPYEASIDFGGEGIKTEWIGENQVAEVNGYQFEGPGVIVREWPLRGVAVCPYGADQYTKSQFARPDEETFSITKIGEHEMAKPATQLNAGANAPAAEATPEEKPQEATAEVTPAEPVAAAEPAAALSADRKEAKRFKDAFGDAGVLWYFEGLTFDLAVARQREQFAAENKKLSDRVAVLESEKAEFAKKLGTPAAGEATPVGFDAGGQKTRTGLMSKIRIAGRTK